MEGAGEDDERNGGVISSRDVIAFNQPMPKGQILGVATKLTPNMDSEKKLFEQCDI